MSFRQKWGFLRGARLEPILNQQQKFFLLLLDFSVFIFSVFLIGFVRSEIQISMILNTVGIWFITAVVLMLFYVFGSYDINHSTTTTRMTARTAIALLFSLALVILINYFGGRERSGIFGRGILIGSLFLFGFISIIYRIVISQYLKKVFAGAEILMVATRDLYLSFKADLANNPYRGKFSFLLEKVENGDQGVIGNWQSDHNQALGKKWHSIVVALDEAVPEDLVESLMLARFESNRLKDLVQFYEETWQKVPLYYLKSRWFMLTSGFVLLGNPIRQRLKRLMDVFLAIFFLLLASPVMLMTAILIRIESSGPVIYRQTRTGRDGKPFVILKFRSMRLDAEKSGAQWAKPNDERITGVGKFIRLTRIDELPQLFNILKGSMSFVGPRPERPEFNQDLEQKIPFYNLRHIVQPGLTGWAQVLYPYGGSIEDAKEKLQYDLFYIKRYSLWLDISIVLKTVRVVLFGRGR